MNIKIIAIILLVGCLMMLCLFGCGDTNDDNDPTKASPEEIAEAKSEIENYIKVVSPALTASSLTYANDLKDIYFDKIDKADENVENIKKECLLKIELTYISDKKEAKLEQIHDEYDLPIIEVENAIYAIELEGYYTGTQASYNAEIASIDEQLRKIETERAKEISKAKSQSNISGVGGTGYLENALMKINSKYNAQRKEYDNLKNQLKTMWENKSLYYEGLAVLSELESERDSLINSANNEYTRRKNQIDTELSALKQ